MNSSAHAHSSPLTTHCDDCGGLCCFADDSTYSVSSRDQDTLEEKLNERYNMLAEYMTNNKLKLNDEKTHLIVMTTEQKRRRMKINTVINTSKKDILPIKSVKLLGIDIQENLKWSEYILNNDKSLIKQLNSRLSALKMISGVASFKTRLMIANGIFCSKLIFEICVWGGTEEFLLDALQKIQNKAARTVTKRGIYTPVSELLRQCGWLSVRQLVHYHSVLTIYKTLQTTCPKFVHEKLQSEFSYNTRLAASEVVRMGSEFQAKLSLTEKSFMNRSTVCFNQLPLDIRKIPKPDTFKKNLKLWVSENIPL